MTPLTFRALLDRHHLDRPTAARLLDCSISSIANWRMGRQPVPDHMARLLTLIDENPDAIDRFLAESPAPPRGLPGRPRKNLG